MLAIRESLRSSGQLLRKQLCKLLIKVLALLDHYQLCQKHDSMSRTVAGDLTIAGDLLG